tara:strand:- start:13533 stop:15341 length:1809 start_codon:yes stop_codon:yes gene_type:complete
MAAPAVAKIAIFAVDKTKKGFASIGKSLMGLTKSVFSLKTALVAVAGVAGFAYMGKASLNATSALSKTAAKIGTTTDALSKLQYAAGQTGVDTNTLNMAMQRFARRTAEAAQGTGEAKGALKELGVNASKLVNMPLDERMMVLADAFQNVKGDSDKLRLAFKLFDSEGAALVNTLAEGRDGLHAMFLEAETLGAVMSQSAASGVEDANDALNKLGTLMGGIKNQMFASMAPAFELLADTLRNKVVTGIQETNGSVEQFARTLAINVLTAIQGAVTGFQMLANGFITVYNSALQMKDGLTRAFTSDENMNARQLTAEIEELNAELAGGKTRQMVTTAKKRRIEELKALRAAALDAGESLALMNKQDFAKGLNKLIEDLKVSLETLPEAIAPSTKTVVDSVGAMEASFNSWSDSIPTMDENIKSLTDQGLNGLTDSLTAAVTGAANFKDAMKSMAKSVVDSLIKMLIQKYIVDAAFNAITTRFSPQGSINASGGYGQSLGGSDPFATSTFKAIGGSVQAGQPYMVGERGQEMFVPNQSGSIIPNNQMGGSGVTINQTINISTGVAQTVRAEVANLMPQIASAAKGAVADARQRGGGYSQALIGA